MSTATRGEGGGEFDEKVGVSGVWLRIGVIKWGGKEEGTGKGGYKSKIVEIHGAWGLGDKVQEERDCRGLKCTQELKSAVCLKCTVGHRSWPNCFSSLPTSLHVYLSYSLGCTRVLLPASSYFPVRIVPQVDAFSMCLWGRWAPRPLIPPSWSRGLSTFFLKSLLLCHFLCVFCPFFFTEF